MSQAKRTRKARMKTRQEKRREALYAQLESSREFLEELRDRRRFRVALNASDMPEPVKKMLGAVIDPIGFAVDTMAQYMRDSERKEQTDEGRHENPPADP